VLQLRGWRPDREVSLGRIPIQDEMRLAAELEDGTEKSVVTPGPLSPARELLGEMLLDMNERAQTLQQFEATLRKEPGRFRALYGASTRRSSAGIAIQVKGIFASC
jgi:hypothetical protein